MDDKFKYPSEKIIKVWRVKYYVLITLYTIAYIIILFALAFKINSFFWFFTAIYAALILIHILSLTYLPRLGYKRRKYLFTNDRIEVIKGIIFKTTTMIPISRIQHITVTEGPLLRHYSLASVVVFTTSSTLVIDGLESSLAMEIASSFKNKVNIKAGKENL